MSFSIELNIKSSGLFFLAYNKMALYIYYIVFRKKLVNYIKYLS